MRTTPVLLFGPSKRAPFDDRARYQDALLFSPRNLSPGVEFCTNMLAVTMPGLSWMPPFALRVGRGRLCSGGAAVRASGWGRLAGQLPILKVEARATTVTASHEQDPDLRLGAVRELSCAG